MDGEFSPAASTRFDAGYQKPYRAQPLGKNCDKGHGEKGRRQRRDQQSDFPPRLMWRWAFLSALIGLEWLSATLVPHHHPRQNAAPREDKEPRKVLLLQQRIFIEYPRRPLRTGRKVQAVMSFTITSAGAGLRPSSRLLVNLKNPRWQPRSAPITTMDKLVVVFAPADAGALITGLVRRWAVAMTVPDPGSVSGGPPCLLPFSRWRWPLARRPG